MHKETITYNDYNGTQRTETFYFNLNKAEILKMQMGVDGGLAEMIQRIIDTQDVPSLINIWEDLIKKSYGVKALDGKAFLKRPEDLEVFMATEAYSELYMKLATDADAAGKFINEIFPADLVAQVQAQNPALNSAN